MACIVIGVVSIKFQSKAVIPTILLMYTIQRISTSTWYILETKYLNNFTKESMRNKITFTYEFIGGIGAGTFSVLGGLLLEITDVKKAFLIVGLFALACMTVVLDYMKKRFGLKPEEYKKEDLEFETIIK